MTTVRFTVAVALVALVALVACSKDKGGDKPEPKAADAAAKTPAPDAALAAADAAPAPAADAAAADPPDEPDEPDKPDDSTGKVEPKDDSERPKNVKLLPKSWDVPKIKGFMKTYNKALGVKCEFCHDLEDYSADGNEKKVAARKMIGMTRATNSKFFKGKGAVTCMTCHRGKEHPE
jgi:hypothetical protein